MPLGILFWIAAYVGGSVTASALTAKIQSISRSEISPAGYRETVLVWETSSALQFQISINRSCTPSANGMQAQAGRQETIINAIDLVAGKNDIRICLEDRGERAELQVVIYRDDSLPSVRAFPEPSDWNGAEPILLNCTNCATMRHSLESEKSYTGPITIPADGGKLNFYAISLAGVKSESQSLDYDRKESSKPWRSGRAHIAPVFMMTTGGLRDILPTGWGGILSYEQGPDVFLSFGRAWYIPGARAELGTLYLTKQESREILLPFNAGPLWEIAPFDRHAGRLFFASLFGVTYISAVAGDFSRAVFTTDMQLVGGYRFPWDNLALRLAGRYLMFFDKTLSLTGFGGEIGLEYILF